MQAQSSSSMEVAMDPHTTQMNQFMSYIKTLDNPDCKDDVKLKAIQEISNNFEVAGEMGFYSSLLNVGFLDDTEFHTLYHLPQFVH